MAGLGSAGSISYSPFRQDRIILFQKPGDGGRAGLQKPHLMTPLLPTSASELLTSSTSVPVGASSGMVVWKTEAVKMGALSLTSLTKTVTVHVPLREGSPGDGGGDTQAWVSPFRTDEGLPV